MADIVVAGHICLDILPQFLSDAEFLPGKLIEVGKADLSTGGCVPNVGRNLHRLGIDVRLVGKVGNDPFGDVVISLLKAEAAHLAGHLFVSEGGTTSYSVVLNPLNRDRTFLHMPGENDTFTVENLTPSAILGAKVVHFGYPPLMAKMFANKGHELDHLLAKVHAHGAATSLDLSLPDPVSSSGKAPWREILQQVLPRVDFFFPSLEEISFMLGTSDDPNELAEECLSLGAGVVTIKCGENGLVCRTADKDRLARIPLLKDSSAWANQSRKQPCFLVEPVGTTGAGDATIAGILMGLVQGFDLAQCLEAGCAVGACCVEASDAVSGVRSWPEIEARILRGWSILGSVQN